MIGFVSGGACVSSLGPQSVEATDVRECRRGARIRINGMGGLEIIDPGLGDLDLLRAIDPTFEVRAEGLAHFSSPRFQKLRAAGSGVLRADLESASDDFLWAIVTDPASRPKKLGEVSLLDLNTELARRMLVSCSLCGHRCHVNRLREEVGICGLGTDVPVAEHFTHIGEEPVINPSYVFNLAGCGLRCRYCQQSSLLSPSGLTYAPLAPKLWDAIDLRCASSISFAGGNPDESLFSILKFLAGAPDEMALPLVWNTHGYITPPTLRLLTQIVDIYLPDLKYGCDRCASRWSGTLNYVATVQSSIASITGAGIPTIVRVLVLPGHFECCHEPALSFLSSLPGRSSISVSIRAQYSPDWRITAQDGDMARRPTKCEIDEVRRCASALGLHLA